VNDRYAQLLYRRVTNNATWSVGETNTLAWYVREYQSVICDIDRKDNNPSEIKKERHLIRVKNTV